MPDVLFADRLRSHGDRSALISECGARLSYAALAAAVDASASTLSGPARVVIVEFANVPECVIAYLACLRAGYPVILVEPGSTASDSRTSVAHGAALIFHKVGGLWRFDKLDAARPVELHPELCILLSTSGTTGSPKLVRLSRNNIESNAASIVEYLGIAPNDRAITSLPLYYSYGMSVLNSHLYAGAAILLTERSVADDTFWTFFAQEQATTLAGVPFTFDVLERIGFRGRNFPSLRYLTQAGGRLSSERVTLYAQWAKACAKQVFVMYGQTEASPRMAYMPADQLADNIDCIGVPIPGGSFELVDDDGIAVLGPDCQGELVYRGPNVMMGYAQSASELALGSAAAVLRTGDLACRKPNGHYYIVGRKNRFSKILGLRISLDEVERWIHSCGWHGVVSGDDRLIVTAVSGAHDAADIKRRLAQRFALPASALIVLLLDPIPTLASNKFDYRQVLRLGHAANDQLHAGASSLLEGYAAVLDKTDLRPGDSFLDVGGDSVNFVEISLLLESYLGYVPENWEASSIESLEACKTPGQPPSDGAGIATGGAKIHHKKASFFQVATISLALLLGAEVALQVRSYVKTGRSAMNLALGESTVMPNPKFGVRTYRPNMVDEKPSDDRVFTTNSLGFRSPEIASIPAPAELRIAIFGASTVAGTYAKTNSATFPSLLEKQLRQHMPTRTVNVINAGVEGYTVRDIDLLVERTVTELRPNLAIVYGGFNDMVLICKASAGRKAVLRPLPRPDLPHWVLSRELISKNTVALREAPVRSGIVDPAKYFPTAYGDSLNHIATTLKAAGVETVLLTVARGFKPADGERGKQLAATALFYNYCLDYDGLNKAGNMFNSTIESVAGERQLTLIDLAKKMPSGSKYFVDAAHFTFKGEQMASDIIYQELISNQRLATSLGIKSATK